MILLKIFAISYGAGNRHEAARSLLREKYRQLFQKEMPDILTHSGGRPYLSDGSAFFSISYTAGFCFCAISDKPVGLDAEMVRKVKDNTVNGVLSAAERDVLSANKEQDEMFMRFWTLKEAYCKYTGNGICGTRLRETEFNLSEKQPVLCGRQDLRFDCRTFDMEGARVVLSVCTDSPCCPEFYF